MQRNHFETEGNQKEEKILKEARGKLQITFKRPSQIDSFSTTKYILSIESNKEGRKEKREEVDK